MSDEESAASTTDGPKVSDRAFELYVATPPPPSPGQRLFRIGQLAVRVRFHQQRQVFWARQPKDLMAASASEVAPKKAAKYLWHFAALRKEEWRRDWNREFACLHLLREYLASFGMVASRSNSSAANALVRLAGKGRPVHKLLEKGRLTADLATELWQQPDDNERLSQTEQAITDFIGEVEASLSEPDRDAAAMLGWGAVVESILCPSFARKHPDFLRDNLGDWRQTIPPRILAAAENAWMSSIPPGALTRDTPAEEINKQIYHFIAECVPPELGASCVDTKNHQELLGLAHHIGVSEAIHLRLNKLSSADTDGRITLYEDLANETLNDKPHGSPDVASETLPEDKFHGRLSIVISSKAAVITFDGEHVAASRKAGKAFDILMDVYPDSEGLERRSGGMRADRLRTQIPELAHLIESTNEGTRIADVDTWPHPVASQPAKH